MKRLKVTAGRIVSLSVVLLGVFIVAAAAVPEVPTPTPSPPQAPYTLELRAPMRGYILVPNDGSPGNPWGPLPGSGMELCAGISLYTSNPPKCLDRDGNLITLERDYRGILLER
jgi:hypothetical protein